MEGRVEIKINEIMKLKELKGLIEAQND